MSSPNYLTMPINELVNAQSSVDRDRLPYMAKAIDEAVEEGRVEFDSYLERGKVGNRVARIGLKSLASVQMMTAFGLPLFIIINDMVDLITAVGWIIIISIVSVNAVSGLTLWRNPIKWYGLTVFN